jgi:hypothetical protein
LGEAPSFGGRNPFDEQPFLLEAYVFQEAMHQGVATPGMIVALHIVTISRVAAQDHDAIGPILKGFQDE